MSLKKRLQKRAGIKQILQEQEGGSEGYSWFNYETWEKDLSQFPEYIQGLTPVCSPNQCPNGCIYGGVLQAGTMIAENIYNNIDQFPPDTLLKCIRFNRVANTSFFYSGNPLNLTCDNLAEDLMAIHEEFGHVCNHPNIPDTGYPWWNQASACIRKLSSVYEITVQDLIDNDQGEFISTWVAATGEVEGYSLGGPAGPQLKVNCPEIEGCTDSNADNYNPEANIDDGSCEYCTEFESLPYYEQLVNCSTYSNWESYENALTNDPYFTNWEGLENIYSDLISIVGPNGICCKDVPDPISGCMDETALNYNPQANTDDGSCEYPMKYRCSACEGCIEDINGPFDTLDDCQKSGCYDGNLENYAMSLGMVPGTLGIDGTEMSAADQFCIKCQAQLEDPKCECCNTDYTYYDDYNILTYNPDREGIPPKDPDKDPVKDRMQQLANIKTPK